MRLNLLPKATRKRLAGLPFLIAMIVLVILNFAAAWILKTNTSNELAALKEEQTLKEQEADKVRKTAARADEIVASAKIVLTNTALAHQIEEANVAYPDLYDELLEYIPSFFRVRSITASSSGENATVVIQGYLKTFQQYSDMMIALLRFPGAQSVGRSGFGPVAPGDEGPFGYNPDSTDRGPIPGWSSVTFTLVIQGRDLRAPDIQPTLRAAAEGVSTPGVPTGGGGGGGTPPPAGGGAAPGGRRGPALGGMNN
ncbi:MAG: hypothetical protein KatS3mg015_0805 [Fimbriimonadales bacterium]|nr:MAG: hypothetical protein KatS3mg015_0805 [Fimbriimonadales bacterium]